MLYELQLFAAVRSTKLSPSWVAAAMALSCDICYDDSASIFVCHCCVTAHSEKRICAQCAWMESCHHRHRCSNNHKIQPTNSAFVSPYRCPFCQRADPIACYDLNGVHWSEQQHVWNGAFHTWWLSELGKTA